MIYTFKRKRIFQACGCLALAALASAFLIMGLVAPPDVAIIKWLAFGAAGMMYGVLIPAVLETFTPGPILTIAPDGLKYQPFSPQPIPWIEVTAIKRVRDRVGDGKTANPNRDVIRFAVRDASQLPLKKGLGGAMMATQLSRYNGAIQIDAVQASADEIVAAIKPYWRGDIPIVLP
jgi:hypothetical protein